MRNFRFTGIVFTTALTLLFNVSRGAPTISAINGVGSTEAVDEYISIEGANDSNFYSWANPTHRRWQSMPLEGTPISFQWHDRRHSIFSTGSSHAWNLQNDLQDTDNIPRTLPHFASPIKVNPNVDELMGMPLGTGAVLPAINGFSYKGTIDFQLTAPGGTFYNQLSTQGKADAMVDDANVFDSQHRNWGWYVEPSPSEPFDAEERSKLVWPSGTNFWRNTYNGATAVLPIEGKNFVITFNHTEHANIVGQEQDDTPGNRLAIKKGEFVDPISLEDAYGVICHYKYNTFFEKFNYDIRTFSGFNLYDFPVIDLYDVQTYGWSHAWPPVREPAYLENYGGGQRYNWWGDNGDSPNHRIGETWLEYTSSVTINVINFASDGTVISSFDFGPTVWPSGGYLLKLSSDPLQLIKINTGTRNPTSIRDGNYVYLYYFDSDNLKLVRSDITGFLNYPSDNLWAGQASARVWDFQAYSADDINGDPIFAGSPLPPGFINWVDYKSANQESEFAQYVNFLSTAPAQDGKVIPMQFEAGNAYTNQWSIRNNWFSDRNSQVYANGDPELGFHQDGEAAWVSSSWDGTLDLKTFSVAKVKNSNYWVALRAHTIEETNVWIWDAHLQTYVFISDSLTSVVYTLHVSDDLVHWSEGKIVNNSFTSNRAPAFLYSTYPRLLNEDGETETEIDPNHFFILATSGLDEVQRIPVSITISNN